MTTEASKRAVAKYDAKNTRQYHLKLNLKTDADIIQWLDKQDSMQGYIKDLIRNDMGYHKSVEDMERRVHEDLKEVSPLTFPAQDGYRDEEAIREFLENGNRLLVHRQGNWEVRVDVDARKVLAVDYLLKTNI